MILTCQNISKSFGVEVVLKDVSFGIEENEKAAVVGINGAGKSTLLKIIMGELEADSGSVTLAKGCSIGYLPQHPEITGTRTIYEEVLESKRDLIEMEEKLHRMEDEMEDHSGEDLEKFLNEYHRLLHEFEARDGYAYRSEVSGILKGLGFTDGEFQNRMGELSGGQKTRVLLAKLLVTKPDIILMDEPTNHLDIASISWLENYLLNYRGAVVIVAHDRYFLDRVATKVIEIDRHQSMVFRGNYSDYAVKKRQAREAELKAYLNQQQEIRHQEAVITKLKQFNREKSIKRAESREKMLDRMEVLEKPVEEDTEIRLAFKPAMTSGNDVLTVEGLSKSYGDKELFTDIGFEIRRGERVALIGPNGTGKTTILKIINGKVLPDAGEVEFGARVKIGYYDQEQQELDPEKTVFSEIADAYPKLTETRIRTLLAAFLFTGDDVWKTIADLSGGERGRVSLAKLMLSDANFLILDEPTNHLDITSREVLESALVKYEGTILFVSHDRYFINQTATRILDLAEHQILNYIGNYDYYLEKKADVEAAYLEPDQKEEERKAEKSAAKADWKQRKEEQSKRRSHENAVKKAEGRIEELEGKIAAIDREFEDPSVAVDAARLAELQTEREELDGELTQTYEEWEKLVE